MHWCILVHRPNCTSINSSRENPLDLFLWGRLREIVYGGPLTHMETLATKFHAAVATVDVDML